MWNRKELKAKGKAAFRANYWRSVLAALIAVLLMGGGAAVAGRGATRAGAEQGITAEQEITDTETPDLAQVLEDTPPEIVIAILVIVLGVFAAISAMVTLIGAFLFNPLKVGCYRFFLLNSDAPADLSELAFVTAIWSKRSC